MATIINNPPAQAPAPSDGGGGGLVAILVGIVILVVVGFFFFAYGLPLLRGIQGTSNTSPSPTINVPDTIDVNIKQ